MRSIKQPIARMANQTDDCTGAFWEGRYKSIVLTDEQAVIATMSYVDLNQVRAGLVDRPEDAVFSGLAERCAAREAGEQGLTQYSRPQSHNEAHRRFQSFDDSHDHLDHPQPQLPLQACEPGFPHRPGVDDPNDAIDHEPSWLMPINQLFTQGWVDPDTIHLSQGNYLNLVDQTGRSVKSGKRGSIDPTLAPLLQRIGVTAQQWESVHTTTPRQRLIYGTGTYLGKTISAGKEMLRRGLQRCRKTWLDPKPQAADAPY